ncbi:MAG: CRISPR-associated helicase Cas3' [Thermoguttaceae bacterium]
MIKPHYAHTKKGMPPEQWQLITEHADQTSVRAAEFARPFGSEAWAKIAAILHDLGKYDARFQNKLYKENGFTCPYRVPSGVNHSGHGAAFAEEKFGKNLGRTLAYLIAGHHAGLPDYQSDRTGTASLVCRMTEAKDNLNKIRQELPQSLERLETNLKLPRGVTPENYHLWVRMLFSCLVDADWLDTERFMNPERFAKRPSFPSLEELGEMFWQSMNATEANADTSLPINHIRHEIFEACCLAASKPPGLFTLTVPTGGGKTLSSVAFAIKHAQLHKLRRLIYVIPYTSIIEQTAAILRSIFGDANVVEHHSNIDRSAGGVDEDTATALEMAAENWDAPIIVTTNVQFFESLYAARPSRCRKLHNIAESVVVLDEAQLITPEYLTPCIDVLNHLAATFRTSIVLCTATQPAFSDLPASLPKLNHATEIVPEPQRYYQSLQRVEYQFPNDPNRPMTWEELAETLQQHDRVLCVVNTRRDCRKLYELVKKYDDSAVHLSALMCGEHRSDVIKNIKERLKSGTGPLRVISTQLVEAGVDIDFPVVFRAMAGLDSIVQAAGRCNREGRLPNMGKMFVFVPETDVLHGLIGKGVSTTRELLLSGDPINAHDPATYTRYFAGFYSSLNDTGQEFIDDLLPTHHDGSVYFRDVGDHFRLIDDKDSIAVIVKYGQSVAWIDQLRKEGPSRDLMRSLQRYTVNLRKYAFDKLVDSGAIVQLNFHNKPIDIYYQNLDSVYDSVFGLDAEFTGLSAEELVV